MIRTVPEKPVPPVEMEVVTDPAEIARFRQQFAQFQRNVDWLQAHAHEVYSRNRGRYVSIAGQEAFAGDTAEEAQTAAEAKHPGDHGSFLQYIPPEKRARA
ncbi:MAG TPA: hypothetical protein VH120_21135 [Gemmataceae bacterium]|nr:hypothetical protein [Gemmataceae bacterium]